MRVYLFPEAATIAVPDGLRDRSCRGMRSSLASDIFETWTEIPLRMRFLFFLGNGPLDRRDERRARSLRESMGRCGRLVSWCRDVPRDPKGWTARVSCGELPETVEGTATSRHRAICAAVATLERRLSAARTPEA